MKPDAELAAFLAREKQIGLRRAVPLSSLTSMQVGGDADCLLFPRDPGAFLRLLDCLYDTATPFRILGNGTKLIAPDEGVRDVLVATARLDRISRADTALRLGAGVPLPRAANAAREAGLSGMEELYGIPGTVGGAIKMNAGAFGRELGELVSAVTVYDPRSREVSVLRRGELAFGYRSSGIGKEGLTVLSAVLELAAGDPCAIAERMHEISKERAARQPMGIPSAGSVFRKTASGESAGRLIAEAGLAGKRIGGAEISGKHAGFIVNRGGATAADLRALAEEARRAVKQKNGVWLEYEWEFL